ncbi:hypothetical protein FQZ97_937040 [compost metagenome]
MTNLGIKLRQRYLERMQQVAVGALLERKGRVWEVIQQHRTETGVMLTLRHGRRDFRLYIGVTMDGPELWHLNLRSAAPPPSQRELFTRQSMGGAQSPHQGQEGPRGRRYAR